MRSRCVAAQHRSSASPRARAATSAAATAAISTVVALIADAPRSPLSLTPGHGIVAPYEELLPAGGRVAAACIVVVVARAGHLCGIGVGGLGLGLELGLAFGLGRQMEMMSTAFEFMLSMCVFTTFFKKTFF